MNEMLLAELNVDSGSAGGATVIHSFYANSFHTKALRHIIDDSLFRTALKLSSNKRSSKLLKSICLLFLQNFDHPSVSFCRQ